jgi:hypothetical protein
VIIGRIIMIIVSVEQIEQKKTVYSFVRMKRPEANVPKAEKRRNENGHKKGNK